MNKDQKRAHHKRNIRNLCEVTAEAIEKGKAKMEKEYEDCPTCKGEGLKLEPDGNYYLDDLCDDCWGTGMVEKEQ